MADVDKSRAEAQRLLTYQQADRYIEYHLLSGKRIAIPNDICIMRFKPAWILNLFPFIADDCTCNFMENGVAILWKNYLQLFSKSTCKKHHFQIAALQYKEIVYLLLQFLLNL
jgi:hypothetical protein